MFFYTAMADFGSSRSTWMFTAQMELGDFILLWISLIVLFAWIFSILYILWWGVLLILSWWKDDKVKPAINSIRYALIGLAFIVVAIFIFPRLAGLLWLDVDKYSSPDKIFWEIQRLGDKILWNEYSKYELDWKSIRDIDTLPSDFSRL